MTPPSPSPSPAPSLRPSALRAPSRPKKTARVHFAPDTKEIDTSDVSARKYRRPPFAPLFAAPKPPTAPAPPRYRPDYREAVASRERMSHMSRSWMY